jgi:hypothetical protein
MGETALWGKPPPTRFYLEVGETAPNAVLFRGYREIPGDTERYREIPRDTERYREIPGDTERYREIPRDTGRYREIPGDNRQGHRKGKIDGY